MEKIKDIFNRVKKYDKTNKKIFPIIIVSILILIGAITYYVNPSVFSFLNLDNKNANASQETVGKAVDFINENILSQQGITASLVGVITEESGLYKFKLKIGEQEEFDFFVTKNGKLFFPQYIELEKQEDENSENTEQEQLQDDSSESNSEQGVIPSEEMDKFIACLAQSDFVIYGASWCGWTGKIVNMLGGFESVNPVYIECEEETEICAEKNITGYPTILIAEKQYQGARTFADISSATGCPVPLNSETADSQQNLTEGECE